MFEKRSPPQKNNNLEGSWRKILSLTFKRGRISSLQEEEMVIMSCFRLVQGATLFIDTPPMWVTKHLPKPAKSRQKASSAVLLSYFNEEMLTGIN